MMLAFLDPCPPHTHTHTDTRVSRLCTVVQTRVCACPFFGRVSDSDALAEKFECKLCGKVYQWKQSLKRHIREDRCDKGPQHACPRCGMSFKHTSRLNKHVILCPHIMFDNGIKPSPPLTTYTSTTTAAAAAAAAGTSSTSTVQRILKLPPPCPDALPITAVSTGGGTTTATSSPSQTILVLHLKNQSLAQNWNSKIQKLGK